MMSEFKKDFPTEEIEHPEQTGGADDIFVNPGSVERRDEEIVEMKMEKEARGELFLRLLDSLKKDAAGIESPESVKKNILAELERLEQSYEEAYFGDNLVKERNCWLILKGCENSDLKKTARIMEGVERSLREEEPGEGDVEENPTYH
jgi:hypothetical protein